MAREESVKNTDCQDVVIIGAGASGLTAAIAAARTKASVLVLNHHSVPGKKILSTGNGKCNFTNEIQNGDCYRSDDPDMVSKALEQFSFKDTVRFFEGIGVYSKQKNGYYYPLSGQAVTVRDALLDEAEYLNVEILNDVDIENVISDRGRFIVGTRTGNFETKKCILAAGGMSAPKTGSDGSGYKYATELGHSLVTPLPALVPLTSDERWLRRTAGVRCDGSVTLFVDGQEVAFDRGELQFVEGAISGIPVFQVSRFASIALDNKKNVTAVLDLFPDMSTEDLYGMLMDSCSCIGDFCSWYKILCGFCNQKIAGMLCHRLSLDNSPLHQSSYAALRQQAASISEELKKISVPINGTGSIEYAQTTCGGIPASEIGPDMQSKIVPGIYFAGEIINVDGICGGYNLQWAFTSGYLAGTYAAK